MFELDLKRIGALKGFRANCECNLRLPADVVGKEFKNLICTRYGFFIQGAKKVQFIGFNFLFALNLTIVVRKEYIL